ncbi:aarF domain-containing protein kinase 1 isoform X2 [Panulirus ornatus]|uniref:aarF domain-containing protein kinase 1 isoform X2 n=1 Tax=Panulirus ornatus TaxID=150431 RepID=UPI003A88A32B
MAHRLLLRLGLLGVGGASITYNIDDIETAAIGAVRFGRAAVTVTKIVADYRTTLYSGSVTPESDGYMDIKSQTHLRSAKQLLELCCLNGGAFVKVGQHLGSLEYLLPLEYVNTMKVLHSNAPKSSLQDIYQVIEEELKCKPEELFVEFEPEPLGAASLAQVHRARLYNGQEVAVKVQHPTVKAHSRVDMKGMEIPAVDWSHTTDRVLVMEFCEGGQVNDKNYMVTHDINTNEVSEKISKMYSEMIFVNGYVHCDPHPGNVLVKKVNNEAQIILLDHGLYTSLTSDFRLTYSRFWLSILNADLNEIQRYGDQLGVGELFGLFACMVTGRSWDSITKGIDKKERTSSEQDEIKADAAKYLPEISAVLNRVPRQMLLIFKTNDLLRGIEFSLNTQEGMKSFVIMSRCCIRSLFAHKRMLCNSLLCAARVSIAETWAQFKITLYTLYLLCIRSELGKFISKTWMTNNSVKL